MSAEIPHSLEEEKTSGAPVVYLPEAIPTPPTIFALYLLQRAGALTRDYQIFHTLASGIEAVGGNFVSISLHPGMVDRMRERVFKIAREISIPTEERHILVRLANYLGACQSRDSSGKQASPLIALARMRASPLLYQRLVEVGVKHADNPKKAIEEGVGVLHGLVEKRQDPFKIEADGGDVETDRLIRQAREVSWSELQRLTQLRNDGEVNISFEIPELYREGEAPVRIGETREIGQIDFKRSFARLRILEGNSIRVVVVGPPHSGKSTFVASLVTEMNALLDRVTKHGIDLRVTPVDLDKSTPDVRRILIPELSGERRKVGWDEALARTAAGEFLTQTGNVLIADAPGGRPDAITETVIAPADLGITLLRVDDEGSWVARRDEWIKALKGVGVRPVIQLRSRLEGEKDALTTREIGSNVTNFRGGRERDWVEKVGGRVVGLNRAVKRGDPCIVALAHFLLFDFCPGVVIAREEEKLRYLDMLQEERRRLLAH